MPPLVIQESTALFQPFGEGIAYYTYVGKARRIGSAPFDRSRMSLHDFVLAARNNQAELQTGLMVHVTIYFSLTQAETDRRAIQYASGQLC